MTLLFKSLTDETKTAVAAHFRGVKQKVIQMDHLMSVHLDDDSVEVSDSHPVYVLSAQSLASGGTLKDAKMSSTRCFVASNDNISAVELNTATLANAPSVKISSINEGPFSVEFLRAVEIVSHLAEVQNNSYEVRFLLVPALYIAALWLHAYGEAERQIDLICELPVRFDSQKKLLVSSIMFEKNIQAKAVETLKAQKELGYQ